MAPNILFTKPPVNGTVIIKKSVKACRDGHSAQETRAATSTRQNSTQLSGRRVCCSDIRQIMLHANLESNMKGRLLQLLLLIIIIIIILFFWRFRLF